MDKASGISHDLIKYYIPFQNKCILEGKLKIAALTTEIFEIEKDIKDLNPPNYQTLAHNYSKQKEKENLTYLPASIVDDDGAYDYSKYKPRASSSGVSILGPPPQAQKGLSRRPRKAIRKESLQNFDSRPSRSEEGQSSNMVPDVIYKMEKQIELLSRQFQSVNAKLSGNQNHQWKLNKNKNKSLSLKSL